MNQLKLTSWITICTTHIYVSQLCLVALYLCWFLLIYPYPNCKDKLINIVRIIRLQFISLFCPPQLPGQCPCICKTQPYQPLQQSQLQCLFFCRNEVYLSLPPVFLDCSKIIFKGCSSFRWVLSIEEKNMSFFPFLRFWFANDCWSRMWQALP